MSKLIFIGGGGVADFFVGGHVANVASTASHSFDDIDLGATYPTGLLVLGVAITGGGAAVTIGSVTVNGNAATQAVLFKQASSTALGLYYLVGVGGVGDVVVNTSGANGTRFHLSVLKLRGVRSSTPQDTKSGNGNTVSLTIPKNGAGVGLVADFNVATGFVWSGLTKRDELVNVNAVTSCGSQAFDTLQSGLTVGVSSPAPFSRCIVAASWR